MGPARTLYDQRIASGLIEPDPAQAETLDKLDAIAVALPKSRGGWFSKAGPLKGLYLWGGVGRGKSMLMDLFFEAVSEPRKRRVHFHDFMRETHEFLNYWRGLTEKCRKRSQWRVRGAGDDPIQPAAKRIASEARLLCFDEFQVTQIADAMILKRLFEKLFADGVTVVATSNRPPPDLYKDGINRQLFTPFIDLLQTHTDVHEIASEQDYRLRHLTRAPVWVSPLGMASANALDEAWDRLTLGAQPAPQTLTIQNRPLEVPAQAAGVARMSFEDLCARPLGAADYAELAATYHTLILSGIPKLSPEKKNEAIRFTTLIDVLYEAKVNLVASAEAEPDDLYPSGDHSFEFERTASRLYEMRTADYIAAERPMRVEA